MNPFQAAQEKFRAGLSAHDKLLLTQGATADEVLPMVQSLELQHRDRSLTLRLVNKVDPFIRGIEQYGNALGQFANAKPEILSLIWGSACIIIRLLRNFVDLFDKLTGMLQRLARQLGLFDLYARLYPHSSRLKESLGEGYGAYLEFCLSVVKALEGASSKKNHWFKSASLKLMTKSLFKPVKQDFERVISRLESLVDSIETEANAAEKEAAADHRELVGEHIDYTKYQDLLKWLDPMDTVAALLDLSEIHLPGTGQWLIGNRGLHQMVHEPIINCLVTCKAYNLTKHLQQQANDESLVLFYFCDYRSVKSQQTRTVIQTFLADLGRQNSQALDILEARTRRYQKEYFICSLTELVEMLIECLALYQKVHIVIDALDESSNRPELIQLLLSLPSKSQETSLFLTSRDEFDIRGLLGHVEEISVENNDVTSDIDHFIDHTVKELLNNGRLKLRDKTLQETITEKLREKADGMFQYVKCQLDTLSQCISDRAVILMPENLPSSLDQTYVRALERLNARFPDTVDLIQWIFGCIVHSTRPLSLGELSELAAFDVKKGLFDFAAIPTDPHDLLHYSGGLFRLSGAKETLSLVHFSVKEFLESKRICETSVQGFYMGDDTAHLGMLRACLSYLLLPGFSPGECFTERQLLLRMRRFPLLGYASFNWIKHYSRVSSGIGNDWERKVISFLRDLDWRDNLVAWRQALHMAEFGVFAGVTTSYYSDSSVLLITDLPENPMRYAARYCCWPLTELLMREGFDINQRGDEMHPMLEAVFGGKFSGQAQADWNYIKKLLEAGADPHATSRYGNLAFGIVLKGGPDYWNLLKDLPFCTADFEIRSDTFDGTSTILQAFATHPSDPAEWLAYLLGFGVDVNEKDIWPGNCSKFGWAGDSGPPLQKACFHGLKRCASLLLDSGADINYAESGLGSPVQAATRSSNYAMVRLLLDRHADINQVGGNFGTALQAAAWRGDEDLVLLLLNEGANVNNTGGALRSPLAAAVAKQYSGIIDLLLTRGANPGSLAYLQVWEKSWDEGSGVCPELLAITKDWASKTPLTWAIFHEDKVTVQNLVGKGAAVDFPLHRCEGCSGYPMRNRLDHPLCMAIKIGNAEIIDLIRQSSANTWVGVGCPLLTCIECGNIELFHRLRQPAAGSARATNFFIEALYICNDDGHSLELTEIIDAQPVAADPEALSCLWFHSSISSVKAKWLLSKGSTPKMEHGYHELLGGTPCLGGAQTSPLIFAIRRKDYALIDILLQAGLDLNICNGEVIPKTPLLVAAKSRDHALMKRLLDLGASPSINSCRTMSAFGGDSCHNVLHNTQNPETIDVLLSYGAGVDDTCEFCPTALWHAVKSENHGFVLHLVLKGANINLVNFEGETPLQYAQRSNLDDTAELLESLGGTKASGKAQRAGQISSVLRTASQLKFVSAEEPGWLTTRRWQMLGRGLFLLEDYGNSIMGLEMTLRLTYDRLGEDICCSGCNGYLGEKFHLCHDTGFGICQSWCVAKHKRKVQRTDSLKDHVYVTIPRPFFDKCPPGMVALDETTHITRNEWLDRVLTKWRPQADSAGAMSLVEPSENHD